MTPPAQVRDAVLGDAEAMSKVQARSWRVAYRGIAPDDFLDELADDAWVARWSQWLGRTPPPGAHRLVATRDGHVLSVGACGPAHEPLDDCTGELYLLYTDPDHWGHGLGSAVLRAVHRRLAAAGHGGAVLWVAADNEHSIGFYRRLGWELDGATRQEEVSGVTFDAARMVRSLP
jgi:GNAT superfamily N-acetyltransferase